MGGIGVVQVDKVKWTKNGFELEEKSCCPIPGGVRVFTLRSVCAWWGHPEIELNALSREDLYREAVEAGCVNTGKEKA
jgi:hypothetical protein